MADFRVHMIRPSRKHDNEFALGSCGIYDPLALFSCSPHMLFMRRICSIGGPYKQLEIDLSEVTFEHALHLFRKILPSMDSDMPMDEIDLSHVFHVRGDHLWIVGDHRTVEVILTEPLIEVVRHAGVEDGLYSCIDQRFNVPMHEFCGETDGIARNRSLTGEV